MKAKAAVKELAAVALHRSGARRVLAGVRRVVAGGRRVLVFGYHRVCEDFEAEAGRSIESCLISRETLRAHVAFLAGRFELATMSRAVEVLSGRAAAPRDLAVLTFDDGYADVLEHGLPVLQEFEAPATVYVSSGVIGEARSFPHDQLYSLLVAWSRTESMRARTPAFARQLIEGVRREPARDLPRRWVYRLIREHEPAELERLCAELAAAAEVTALLPPAARALDWEGVRALSAAGWEIGAHTVGHAVVTHLGREDLERELSESRRTIEQRIGMPVRHFAYCNGYYNRLVIDALRRHGYASAVTTEDRLNRLGDDPYRIARRVLWEGSARGASGRLSPSLLACQLDDAWAAIGLDASEPGERPERIVPTRPVETRRFA
jgi:peptidoglycan/xylan/chitin deacetylase (PgdA/CDA1 family)